MDLGKPIRPEQPQTEWKPVPGKPHMYVNAKGQLKYAPPLQPLPVPTIFEWFKRP